MVETPYNEHPFLPDGPEPGVILEKDGYIGGLEEIHHEECPLYNSKGYNPLDCQCLIMQLW